MQQQRLGLAPTHHRPQLLVYLLLQPHLLAGRAAEAGEADLFVDAEVAEQLVRNAVLVLAFGQDAFPQLLVVLPQALAVDFHF